MKEIFLSASVPIKGRKYFTGADPLLIHSAVRAFAMLALGRRRIVWGGHPSITPMLWAACESLGVKYAQCVTLYQSLYFEEMFPEENARFRNVKYVQKRKTLAESLLAMRAAMLQRRAIESAVFIGGMEGIADEYLLFRKFQKAKPCLFVAAPGGAARAIAFSNGYKVREDPAPTNFTKLYIEKLGIDPTEKRMIARRLPND